MKPFTILVLLLLASSSFAETTPELIAKLKSPEAKVRRLAAEQLGKAKAAEAIPALGELLKDADDEVFRAVLSSLEQMEAKAVPVLLGSLKQELEPKKPAALSDIFKEKKEPRKFAILTTLYMLSSDAKEAVPVLSELLKHKSVDVRIRAAQAMGEVTGDKKLALPALFEAAKDMGSIGQWMFARPQIRVGNAKKSSPIQTNTVNEAAILAAQKLDPTCLESLAKTILPDMATALKSNDSDIRFAASCAFYELKQFAAPFKTELEQAHRKAKGYTESKLRWTLDALDGGPITRLAATLNNPKSTLKERVDAIQRLGQDKIPIDKALPLLQKALKDPSVDIRFHSLEILGGMGAKAKQAIPDMLLLFNDTMFLESQNRFKEFGSAAISNALSPHGANVTPYLIAHIKNEKNDAKGSYYAVLLLSDVATRSGK